MKYKTLKSVVVAASIVSCNSVLAKEVPLNALAMIKGMASCDCVISGECTYEGETTSECGSGVLLPETDPGDPCWKETAGPADGAECGTTEQPLENPKCEDPNGGEGPACYLVKEGTCKVGNVWPGIPYQYCDYTTPNIELGEGSVRNGPECPDAG